MPISFLKGQPADTSRVIEADTTVDDDDVDPGEFIVTMNDLVSIDSRADVLASVIDEDHLGTAATVVAVDGNDVTVSLNDPTDGTPVEEAEIEVAVSARGY